MKIKFLALILVLFAFACKEKTVEVTKSNSEYLTGSSSKKWKLKDGTAKQGNITLNLIDAQSSCIIDNEIELFSNFQYEFTEGATKCAPQDPQVILKAQWQLSEDQKFITIDRFIFLGISVDKPVFEITQINDDTFSGKSNITVSGQNADIEVIFENVK
ncbi:hypothetical protein SAMN06298216_3135 [Spirosomataceae bacterium TFI 002]|nr:hypothetical protein SAMN06298216_3135 [Spirosomataceae bacterium TFI 002]